MPTDTEASNLSLTYSVNGTDYTSTPAGRIAANGQYELATTVEAGSSSSKVNLNSAITYAAWDSTVVNLSDSFTIDETTPDKQWMGPSSPSDQRYSRSWIRQFLGVVRWRRFRLGRDILAVQPL